MDSFHGTRHLYYINWVLPIGIHLLFHQKLTMSAFKAEDLKDMRALTDLLKRIDEDPAVLDDLPEDELAKVEHYVSAYGQVPESTVTDKWLTFSYTNMSKDYITKLVTTAMVGYLFRRCDEYGRSYQDKVEFMDDPKVVKKQMLAAQRQLVKIEDQIIEAMKEHRAARNERDIAEARDQAIEVRVKEGDVSREELKELNKHIKVYRDAKERVRVAEREVIKLERERDRLMGLGKRYIIREFLEEQFKFNSDKHVRCSYTAAVNKEKGKGVISQFHVPKETFENFKYYLDSNFEEISGVAQRVYGVKNLLDVGILPIGVHTSEDDADDLVQRSKGQIPTDILTIKFGMWNMLEAYKANRDRIEAYRGTMIQDVFDQIKQDAKLGAELTRDRTLRRRMEGLRESNPDPQMAKDYIKAKTKAHLGSGISTNTGMSEEEEKKIRTEAAKERMDDESILLKEVEEEGNETPMDALRINVYNFSDGGSNTKKSHFHIKAKKKAPNADKGGRNLPMNPQAAHRGRLQLAPVDESKNTE